MAGVVAILLIAGCGSLLPEKRTTSIQATEQIANSQQLMIERVMAPTGGTNANERVRVTHMATQSAGAKEDASFKRSLPLSVGIALVAFSAIALMVAWVFYSKFSKTGAASDRAFASTIDMSDQLLTGIVDPAFKAGVQALRAHMEKQRGKVATRRA